MRFLVTGASGFAGRHLASHLAQHGHRVVTLACDDGTRIDIRDAGSVRAAVDRAEPDGIFHLAAVAFVPRADEFRAETREVNIDGTANVLDAAGGLGVRTLVVSSGAVYGRVRAESLPIRETVPFAPIGMYAETKAAAEAECERRRGLQEIVRARAFNHTGPGQSSDYVCSGFARQIAEIEAGLREPVVRHGELAPERDFCDVRDVVGAYLDVFERGVAGDAYNVCSGTPVAISRILEMLIEMSQVPVSTEIRGERLRTGELDRLYGCADKLRDDVGWRPLIPLRTTLTDLLVDWRRRVRVANATGGDRSQ